MSTIWNVASIILPALLVVLMIRWAYRLGIEHGIREAIIDDARHRDHAVEQLGHAVLDMAGAGAEETRLVHDSKCGQWVATGISRHPMGEGGND